MMPFDFPHLLNAAGGEIVGKVRLQKSMYLLDQLGLNSGFSYDYHHYGPYSAGLADDVDADVIFRRVEERIRHRRDGVPYSVFCLADGVEFQTNTNWSGYLSEDEVRNTLNTLDGYSATILELAATIHWLEVFEQVGDWRSELVQRKGVKTRNGRTEEALQLLAKLGLQPQN